MEKVETKKFVAFFLDGEKKNQFEFISKVLSYIDFVKFPEMDFFDSGENPVQEPVIGCERYKLVGTMEVVYKRYKFCFGIYSKVGQKVSLKDEENLRKIFMEFVFDKFEGGQK